MQEYRYLLDTNILSDLVRSPAGIVAARLIATGESLVCTSIVVACELRFGAEKKGSSLLSARIGQLLNSLSVLPLSEEADRHYADIRYFLERSGTVIGPNDLLIAAHARSLGLVVVTDNEREFCRVPGLMVENWLKNREAEG
jgi:tRNA(fMet)-specific endonuclease VapC